ncbi:MAG: cytochrome C oxidase subunit IV family protein [Candidatus Omnitrophica bacterium]|nr:cytochrome C oxidase subunit IV family protein [Candidatus Omnitrophota bacterium]
MKDSKKYVGVGLALLLLTAMTVTVRRLHLGIALAIFIALLIATFKGSLVASFFMHLLSERKIIHILLLSTLFLFIVMMGLVLVGRLNVYEGLRHVP